MPELPKMRLENDDLWTSLRYWIINSLLTFSLHGISGTLNLGGIKRLIDLVPKRHALSACELQQKKFWDSAYARNFPTSEKSPSSRRLAVMGVDRRVWIRSSFSSACSMTLKNVSSFCLSSNRIRMRLSVRWTICPVGSSMDRCLSQEVRHF